MCVKGVVLCEEKWDVVVYGSIDVKMEGGGCVVEG